MSSNIRRYHNSYIVRAIAGITVACVITLTALSSALAKQPDFDDGWVLYQQGRFVEAFEIWKPLADAGDAQAQFNLAVLYEEGRGVDADFNKAAYCVAGRWLLDFFGLGFRLAIR